MSLSMRLSMRLLLLAAGLLVGCQHKPRVDPNASIAWHSDRKYFENKAANQAIPQWRYSAKVGITTDQSREQANLVWQFRDQANSVRLFGPLGAGAIKIDFDQYGVRLSDNKGELYNGVSAERLLKRISGWSIPVDTLSYWLFARPAPTAVFRYQLDEQGSVSVIEQAGWTIRYADYREYGTGTQLPRKLVATKPGTTNSGTTEVSVKLITKSWQF